MIWIKRNSFFLGVPFLELIGMTMSLLDVLVEPQNSTSYKTTATSVKAVKPPQKVQVSMERIENFSLLAWLSNWLKRKSGMFVTQGHEGTDA